MKISWQLFSFHKDTGNLSILDITDDQDPNVASVFCFLGHRYHIWWVQLGENWISSWIGLMQTYGNLFISCELADLETVVSPCAGKQLLPHQVLLTARSGRTIALMVDCCAIAQISFTFCWSRQEMFWTREKRAPMTFTGQIKLFFLFTDW